jgi:hypothetical protein
LDNEDGFDPPGGKAEDRVLEGALLAFADNKVAAGLLDFGAERQGQQDFPWPAQPARLAIGSGATQTPLDARRITMKRRMVLAAA